MVSTTHHEEEKKELEKYVHRLPRLGVCLMDSTEGGLVVKHKAKSSLALEVKQNQDREPFCFKWRKISIKKRVLTFEQGGDGVLRYQVRLCVPIEDGI